MLGGPSPADQGAFICLSSILSIQYHPGKAYELIRQPPFPRHADCGLVPSDLLPVSLKSFCGRVGRHLVYASGLRSTLASGLPASAIIIPDR